MLRVWLLKVGNRWNTTFFRVGRLLSHLTAHLRLRNALSLPESAYAGDP